MSSSNQLRAVLSTSPAPAQATAASPRTKTIKNLPVLLMGHPWGRCRSVRHFVMLRPLADESSDLPYVANCHARDGLSPVLLGFGCLLFRLLLLSACSVRGRFLRRKIGKLGSTALSVDAGPAMTCWGKADRVHAVEALLALACLQFPSSLQTSCRLRSGRGLRRGRRRCDGWLRWADWRRRSRHSRCGSTGSKDKHESCERDGFRRH